ncbi:hypothetical protein [Leptotrichia trevisanii]|uniref:hypothetical protein n=1 Tax=Leptotrichia trevisanii TaxID=109328 RepID=UPI0004182380|nr:hypothetical protein [Leptotrichia trevisanii]
MKQEDLIKQRKDNVKDMLMNVPRVNPDYGKNKDEKLFKARDDALTEQLNNDLSRNKQRKISRYK